MLDYFLFGFADLFLFALVLLIWFGVLFDCCCLGGVCCYVLGDGWLQFNCLWFVCWVYLMWWVLFSNVLVCWILILWLVNSVDTFFGIVKCFYWLFGFVSFPCGLLGWLDGCMDYAELVVCLCWDYCLFVLFNGLVWLVCFACLVVLFLCIYWFLFVCLFLIVFVWFVLFGCFGLIVVFVWFSGGGFDFD